MLASVASTKLIGDQLWIKVIGPAACGKSTLCEAITVSRRYVVAKSTLRGFHSGYKSERGESNEDNSLVIDLYDKTLITKDGDTLLQSPNLSQILSEARDIYDKVSRTHYRNKMSKDYAGINMTWILCGTSSLRSIDSSELGERFLDCVIMERIDDGLEDEILLRVINRADRNMLLEANGTPESQQEPELTEAMQLTGGYVDYLRDNAGTQMQNIENPTRSKLRCSRLAKFVARMRARPSTRQEETAERELAPRLGSQLVRLAKCLAFVLNREEVDVVVMQRVTRVALDTARGQTLEIAHCLHKLGEQGAEAHGVGLAINRTDDQSRRLLRFLRQIEVVENFVPNLGRGIRGKVRWRLTDYMRDLYEDVIDA